MFGLHVLTQPLPAEQARRAAGAYRTCAAAGTYESMTVPELKERCKKRKIKTTGLRKAELIAALRS